MGLHEGAACTGLHMMHVDGLACGHVFACGATSCMGWVCTGGTWTLGPPPAAHSRTAYFSGTSVPAQFGHAAAFRAGRAAAPACLRLPTQSHLQSPLTGGCHNQKGAAIIMESARGDECGRSPGWGQRGRACSRLRRPNRRGAQNYHARMEVAYMHDSAGKRALTCARMHATRAGADQLAPGCGCNAATRGRVPRRPGRCHQPQGGGDGPGSAGSCPECRAQLSAQARVHGRAPSWESTDTGMACVG